MNLQSVLLLAAAVLAVPTAAPTDRPAHIVPKVIGSSVILYADSTVRLVKPTQALDITVQATASGTSSQDPGTLLYTYAYTVVVAGTSPNYLHTFSVRPVPKPVSLAAPTGWSGFYGWEGDTTAIAWSVTDPGPPPANWDGLDIYRGPYDVAPGHSIAGLTIVSHQPPVNVNFYAQGFDTLQGGGEDGEMTDPPTMFQEGVTGTIVGPDINSLVGVEANTPRGLSMGRPAPNPAPGAVSISFSLPKAGHVVLGVYDVAGRRIRTLVDEQKDPGLHFVSWNGNDDRSVMSKPGIYFYRLFVDGKPVGERRVTILR